MQRLFLKFLMLTTVLTISVFNFSCKDDGVSSEPDPEDEPEVTTVEDIDGNVYNTVKIGTQVWMAENLKTTKYNDGTAIPNVTGYIDWRGTDTPAYCWYVSIL